LKAFWYRFAFLALLLLIPLMLIWVLPGSFYPASYLRALELIRLGEHHNDVEEEIEGVKLFQSMYPEHCSSYVHLGDLYLLNNQYDLSAVAYHQAWEGNCLTDAGMLNLVQAEQNDIVALKSDLEKWISRQPKTNDDHYLALINLYQQEKQYQQAADLSERWVDTMPGQAAAWESLFSYALHFPLETMREYARNIPALDTELNYQTRRIVDAYILSAGEGEDVIYYRLGTAYSNNGDWASAQECFERSIAVEPDRTESWINLAIAQKNQGFDSTHAISEAGKLAGDSDIARSLMGIYWRDTDPEIAYVYWMKLIASQPDVPEWRLEAGFSLAQMGDLEGANAFYEQAVNIGAERLDVHAAYVQFCLLYDFNLSTTALEQTRKMIRLEPDNPMGYLLEGQLLLATEDYITAERMFKKALSLDANSAEANYYLGLLYRIVGEQEKAWQHLQLASQSGEGYFQRAAVRLLDSN
jgi:tetratricopeptide (TPR) repeat protein